MTQAFGCGGFSSGSADEAGVYDAGEAEDGDPFAARVGLPDDLSVEDEGGLHGAISSSARSEQTDQDLRA